MRPPASRLFTVVTLSLLSCTVCRAESSPKEREMLLFMDLPTVVTAAKTEQPITDAPATIEVITAKDINAYGFKTLADALRSVPGIDIGSLIYSVYFSPRGLNGRKSNSSVLCLIDGQPLNELARGTVDPNAIPLSNVQRIEIIKGPGSALYGANAFAGVINIITMSPADVDHARVSLAGGNYGTGRQELLLGHASGGGVESFFSFARFRTDATGAHILADNDDRSDTDWQAKVGTKNFTVSWNHFDTDAGIPASNTQGMRGNQRHDLIGLDLDIPLAEGVSAKFLAHVLKNHLSVDQDLIGNVTAESEERGGEFRLHCRFSPANQLVAGVEIKQDVNEAEKMAGRQTMSNKAGFIQDEWHIVDPLILTLGARYDMPSAYGNMLSPRGNLTWKVTDRTVLRASYGEAFRAPNFLELYGDVWISGGRIHFVGNRDLLPEKIKTIEGSLQQFIGQGTSLQVNIFKINTYDMMEFYSSPMQFDLRHGFYSLYQYTNRSEAEIKGGELVLRRRFSSALESALSYSYQEAVDVATGGELPSAPRHKANLMNTIHFTEKLALNTFTYYIGERRELWYDNSKEVDMPLVILTNIRLSYPWTASFESSLEVTNLFDQDYEEMDTFRTGGRVVLLEMGYRF